MSRDSSSASFPEGPAEAGPVSALLSRSEQARRQFEELHRLALQPDQPTAQIARTAFHMTPQAMDRRLNSGESPRHRIRADQPGRRGRGGSAFRSISTTLAEAPVILARPGLFGPALRRGIADTLKTPAERKRLHLAVLDGLVGEAPLSQPLWLSVQTPRESRRPVLSRSRIRIGRGTAPVPPAGTVAHLINLTPLLTPLYRLLLRGSPPARKREMDSLVESLLADARGSAPLSP